MQNKKPSIGGGGGGGYGYFLGLHIGTKAEFFSKKMVTSTSGCLFRSPSLI